MTRQDEIRWSDEAVRALCKAPAFMHEPIRAMARARAKELGLDEITSELLASLKGEAMAGRFGGDPARSRRGEDSPAPENKRPEGEKIGVEAVENRPDGNLPSGSIAWSKEARARLQKAPAFVRAGIVKLAEQRAAERGLGCVTSELLTELRDGAMMKAIRMIKRLGCSELNPEAFEAAENKMKKFRTDADAKKALDEVRRHLEKRSKASVIDEGMLKKMRDYLKKGAGD